MDKITFGNYDFEMILGRDHAKLYYCCELEMAICTAKSEYIPISDFKEFFLAVSASLGQHPIRFFLFDKRKLRTFHQPSMEWYFAVWKPDVKNRGIDHHFKILPDLDWFVKAVEAGKHEIYQKYGKEVLSGIELSYVNTETQAIDIVLKSK